MDGEGGSARARDGRGGENGWRFGDKGSTRGGTRLDWIWRHALVNNHDHDHDRHAPSCLVLSTWTHVALLTLRKNSPFRL